MSGHFVRSALADILGVRITNLSPASAAADTPITTDGGPLRRTYGPWFDGKYQALILTMNKRFSHRFEAQANYTYATSTDDLLNANLGLGILSQGGGAVPSDNNNLEFDRGNSDLLVPHSFIDSGVVDLPVGFRVSGVFRATTGVYFSAKGTPYDIDGDGIVETRPMTTIRPGSNWASTLCAEKLILEYLLVRNAACPPALLLESWNRCPEVVHCGQSAG